MPQTPKIKTEVRVRVIKKGERKPPHKFYFTFNEIKSAAIVLAREIVGDEGKDAPADVRRFLDEFGRNLA